MGKWSRMIRNINKFPLIFLMAKTSQSDLDTVYSLYTMQITLQDLLDTDLETPVQKKEAKKYLQEFSKLLKNVDVRYMGGEDVFGSMEGMQVEVKKKIGK